MLERASADEVAQLRQRSGRDLDVAFLQLMARHHQGGIQMAEVAAALADRPEVRRLARAIAIAQRAELDVLGDLLARNGVAPASESPPALAVVGHEHTAGFRATTVDDLRAAARFTPLVLALAAAAWLGVDAARRRMAPAGAALDSGGRLWQVVAAVGLLLSAAAHAGLAREHFDEHAAYGVFFVLATLLAAMLAGAILAWPARRCVAAGLLVTAGLVVTYVVFRVVPPPGEGRVEEIDLTGLATQAIQGVVLLACAALWLRRRSGKQHVAGAGQDDAPTVG